jgi:hypothetical protein
MKQEYLNNYFSSVWKSNLDRYKYSGWALVDKIQFYDLVLSVGCGFNEFKSRIPNLTGVDPANDHADIKLSIEEYSPPNKFDVAFCLGSINFGDKLTIMNQIACVVNCLKPTARIYWRCNPGRADHGNEHCKSIDFFSWTPELLHQYAEQFGFRVVDLQQDSNNRLYCEWVR